MKRTLTRWKKDEIRRALHQARLVFKNTYVDIRAAPKSAAQARILVVTPAKAGNAVKRNQFRRRARALFHEQNLFEGNYDWVIFAKPKVSELSFAQLRTLFLELAHSLSVPV